jgi:sulfur carrier protein
VKYEKNSKEDRFMKLIINDQETELDAKTLDDVLQAYNLQKGLVVIEVNGEICDPNDWDTIEVTEGMKIELVHFVGGG